MRRTRKVEIEMVDRHGEHVDPDVPLCEHGLKPTLWNGDMYRTQVWLGAEVIAEVEIEWKTEDRLRIAVNHLDYLIAKAKRS